jgi:hypothetical protein
MPSFDHEILVELLRRAPDVVLALLGALAVPLPGAASATVVDRAFSEVSLSEIHADLVVLLRDEDRPRLVVIVEVQRTVDVDKDYTWPLYAAAARREHRCEVAVLVITQDPGVGRASEAIALGPGNTFRVFVVGPDDGPRTDRRRGADAARAGRAGGPRPRALAGRAGARRARPVRDGITSTRSTLGYTGTGSSTPSAKVTASRWRPE